MLVKISDDVAIRPEDIKAIQWYPGNKVTISLNDITGRCWKLNNCSKRKFNLLIKNTNKALEG